MSFKTSSTKKMPLSARMIASYLRCGKKGNDLQRVHQSPNPQIQIITVSFKDRLQTPTSSARMRTQRHLGERGGKWQRWRPTGSSGNTKLDFEQCNKTVIDYAGAIRSRNQDTSQRELSKDEVSEQFTLVTWHYPWFFERYRFGYFPIQGCECGFCEIDTVVSRTLEARTRKAEATSRLALIHRVMRVLGGGLKAKRRRRWRPRGRKSRRKTLLREYATTDPGCFELLGQMGLSAKSTFSNNDRHYAAFEIPDVENRVLSR